MSAGAPADPELQRLVDVVAGSRYFDRDYYRAQLSGLAPVDDLARHYVESGWRQPLNPSAHFDTASYLEVNPDVRASGMNPLVHFLLFGREEGRAALGSHDDTQTSSIVCALAPSAEEWAALPRRTRATAPVVDVVVPVFTGYAETMRCIYSVLAAAVDTPFELWVIDDASPDAEISEALRELAAAERISLLRNPVNRGFVQSCNVGMHLHAARDVVFLNADTEVFAGWLDRLRAASRRPNVGTVTPFSNNAEICSYPRFIRNNDRHLELSDAELAALFATVNDGQTADLPTAVGFCMYVRRDCLTAVGTFDERFGHGYGEENDFSQRAAALGWRNVLAADVFVRHYGGVSFGKSKYERVYAAGTVIATLYPTYHADVRRFIREDPIRPLRSRIDCARIARCARARTFLFVTHMRGGGTERHVNDLVDGIFFAGGGVLFCRAEDSVEGWRVRLSYPQLDVPNLPAVEMSSHGVDAFVDALRSIGVVHVHIHQLADFPPESAEFFRVSCARLGVPYDLTIHDYLVICPRITLTDQSGYYCGEPDEDGCARCLSEPGSDVEAVPIWLWRARYERLLRDARAVFVPDGDVAERLRRYVPSARYVLRPHPEPAGAGDHAPAATLSVPQFRNGRLVRRVGLVGAIGPQKGSRLLARCAEYVRDHDVPLSFSVIGYTDIDEELEALGVAISGRYQEHEADALLARAQYDCVWYPSVWPETYCFALSIALRVGVYPVAFDFGAVAARLRALQWGHLMPIEWLFDVPKIVDRLLTLRIAPPPGDAGLPRFVRDASFVDRYYEIEPAAR